MAATELSIIIVSYNTEELLRNCLSSTYRSLRGSGIRTEVIVVDNASSDGSKAMVRKEFPQVKLVANRDNVGFGRANNQGIRKSEGEYVLLLNSDIVVTEDAIPRLHAYAKRNPRSFVGGKLFNIDGTPQASAGPFFSLPVVFGVLFLRGDTIGVTRYSPNSPRKVDWVSGACIIAPKRLFMDKLLFDEKIFMYMEEIDLLYRGRKKGYRTLFFPHARFIHLGSGSSHGRKQPVLNIYKGFVYFYTKHHGPNATGILKLMLKVKAALVYLIASITGNIPYKETYAEAYKLV